MNPKHQSLHEVVWASTCSPAVSRQNILLACALTADGGELAQQALEGVDHHTCTLGWAVRPASQHPVSIWQAMSPACSHKAAPTSLSSDRAIHHRLANSPTACTHSRAVHVDPALCAPGPGSLNPAPTCAGGATPLAAGPSRQTCPASCWTLALCTSACRCVPPVGGGNYACSRNRHCAPRCLNRHWPMPISLGFQSMQETGSAISIPAVHAHGRQMQPGSPGLMQPLRAVQQMPQ